MTWFEEPDLRAWMQRSRLHAARGINAHLSEPQTQAALSRFLGNLEPAVEKLESFLAETA
jgi:hypothetical protein